MIERIPTAWLSAVKNRWPHYCWAELVMWNMGYRPLLEIFRPEEAGMLTGACRPLVDEHGHGWCGCCRRNP